MDKYLLEILKDKNTIIIPGLGALTITDKTTGAIKFMPYLTHDDGMLVGYISEKEGMEENDSKNLIAKYVREIHAELDKGESYDMFEFGSFYKKGDEIEFKNWGDVNKPKSETVEKKATSKKKASKKTEVKKSSSKKEPEKISSAKPDADSDTIAAKNKEQKTEPSNPTEEKENLTILQKEELSANEKKLDALKDKSKTKEGKRKRGVGFWMLLSLLVIILAGSTYVAINYDDVKQHIPFLADAPEPTEDNGLEKMKQIIDADQQSESPTDEINESDNTEEIYKDANEEEVKVEEEVVPDVQEEVESETPTSNENSFHVIAGAFSSESNAKSLGNKLREQGYDVRVGKGGGMNLVSIKSFATRSEANQALAEFKEAAPNCWVYEWK